MSVDIPTNFNLKTADIFENASSILNTQHTRIQILQ